MAKTGPADRKSHMDAATGGTPAKRFIPVWASLYADPLVAAMNQAWARLCIFCKTEHFKVIVISACSTALFFGAVCGVLGLTFGAATGLAVGVLPALFTFGLSIPVGGVVGGTVGVSVLATLGAGIGAVFGGVVGGVAYAKRKEIESWYMQMTAKGKEMYSKLTAKGTKAKAI